MPAAAALRATDRHGLRPPGLGRPSHRRPGGPVRRAALLALALAGWLALCTGLPAQATLGRAPAAGAVKARAAARVDQPQSAASGSAPAEPAGPYTVHQNRLDSGTVVREYATASGQVFALSWRGPVLPDLAQFLGDYLEQYRSGARQARAAGQRGGALTLRGPDLVLHSAGRMRGFAGYAYAPLLVPGGVDPLALLQQPGAAAP